jgi:beta-xylosidase
MIDSVMIWNEPNNRSHWDVEIDRDWSRFGEMARLAGQAIAAENPRLTRVLGGISPIDPDFVLAMERLGVLGAVDAVAVHGFPLDWHHWPLDEWPVRLAEIRAVTALPLWVSGVGASAFGADEVQEFGLRRTAELLLGASPARIHWYSLFDPPRARSEATRDAERSGHDRQFHMGLVRENGTPRRALRYFSELTPEFGICQWIHFEDHRLEALVRWLKELGVRHLRTGLSWADSYRPGAQEWFDRQMKALEDFTVTVTFCFTPEHRGLAPHHTSPPERPEEFAEFCARMVRRYAK